ncbi:hypothetical protein [Halorhabdus amylolytica]|uniref:hypothetical protein n=1 Tax=Halorhabdus amylolytica TaxID=2559573 RepID=UPI0010A9A567|nr:hypothetical protein [Halorhabdus amylolytica]
MSKALNGVAQINYSEYHKYFTSTGTSLFVLSYLGVFGYLTATFSFAGQSDGLHILFLAVPGIAGIFMGSYGIWIWKKHHDENLSKKRAIREMVESQAELMDSKAEKAMKETISVGGSDITLEDWQ